MKITSVSDCVLNCWVGEVAGISLLELTICADPNLLRKHMRLNSAPFQPREKGWWRLSDCI